MNTILEIQKLLKFLKKQKMNNTLKETVFKTLKAMNDEELCKVFNYFFRRLGTFDSVNTMSCFDDDFSGYLLTKVIEMLTDDFNIFDAFYAYKNGMIYSFNSIKDSTLFESNVDDVVDEVVENGDALGNPTLTRILEEVSR